MELDESASTPAAEESTAEISCNCNSLEYAQALLSDDKSASISSIRSLKSAICDQNRFFGVRLQTLVKRVQEL